ncbi:hypothetical protein [Azospirillum sp. ST 5-10]|uniref:hypothetical protein n=1 Tax=unclassified Azospirillum TaxID=2630922 RepID=UPI003F49E610
MTRSPRLAVLALCAMSAACSVPRVTPGSPSPAYTPGEAAAAASNRDLHVVVLGNPFGMDQDRFVRLVTEAMPDNAAGVPTHFTAVPNASAHPDYRVVLAFNPARTVAGAALCGDQPVPTAPPGGPVAVQAAFCRDVGFLGLFGREGPLGAFGVLGGGALTTASGWLDSPHGADDPAFRTLVRDLTIALFPTEREREDVDP